MVNKSAIIAAATVVLLAGMPKAYAKSVSQKHVPKAYAIQNNSEFMSQHIDGISKVHR